MNGPWDYSIIEPGGDKVEEEGVVIFPYCPESMLSDVPIGFKMGRYSLTERQLMFQKTGLERKLRSTLRRLIMKQKYLLI